MTCLPGTAAVEGKTVLGVVTCEGIEPDAALPTEGKGLAGAERLTGTSVDFCEGTGAGGLTGAYADFCEGTGASGISGTPASEAFK